MSYLLKIAFWLCFSIHCSLESTGDACDNAGKIGGSRRLVIGFSKCCCEISSFRCGNTFSSASPRPLKNCLCSPTVCPASTSASSLLLPADQSQYPASLYLLTDSTLAGCLHVLHPPKKSAARRALSFLFPCRCRLHLRGRLRDPQLHPAASVNLRKSFQRQSTMSALGGQCNSREISLRDGAECMTRAELVYKAYFCLSSGISWA